MKTRFNTYDIVCMVTELQRLVGMRVNQVYDIDNKAYLIRLQRSEEKSVLLLESGNRFHTTDFEWPKNVAPSGFTMKLRKHLKNKRLEHLTQLGIDRIIDFQFGSGEAAYHVILELYDRGNIVLTDHEWVILNVLRPHVEGDKIRFAVKEKYPLDRAKSWSSPPSGDALRRILENSKPGDNLKKILNPNVEYGPAIIDHVLLESGLSGNMKLAKAAGKGFQLETDLDKLEAALAIAEQLLQDARHNSAKGYIIQKKEERPNPEGGGADKVYFLTNVEFHPKLFAQHKDSPFAELDSFDRAVDEFFSGLEGQKIDLKTIAVEREALKKLSNVRKDHEKRVSELESGQQVDRLRAELISRNEELVEQARQAVQTALANQMSWDDIKQLVKTAKDNADPIASCIHALKLHVNHMTLQLEDPYADEEDDERMDTMLVDIDLSLSAHANARRYYDQKRSAAKKQQKTIESQSKALKSAERKTKQTLKEVHTISSINKARKTYWFEKFYWFISSENYLVIGGRDQQQNELLVKRYLRPHDIYVHADVTGASSLIVKGGAHAGPKTLQEAGQAALAYSVSWEAKVITSAWWVHAHQVSKSAPTGEYLTTGSFMIRGKKNFLLPQHLQMGFSFMFRLEDSCIDRHKHERRPLQLEETSSEPASSVQENVQDNDDLEIQVSDDDEDEKEDQQNQQQQPQDNTPLTTITEETNNLTVQETPTDGTNAPALKDHRSDDDDDGSSTGDEFPDTHIKVDHGTGKVIMESKNRTISETSDKSEDTIPSFPSLPSKGRKKPPPKQNQHQTREDKKNGVQKEKEGLKRGQRGKLKKIKEKYKEQDDEDRALMMELLQSSNPSKESKKALKKKAEGGGKSKAHRGPKIPQPAPQIFEVDDDDDAEQEDPKEGGEPESIDAESEMLYQLTGTPLPEDELLFAVPVIAPYSTILNYKFKVKLTPGTGKRGKAAKTALQVFLKDPACSQREKDLLKAVREENTARNFPGKVKLSAPNLHKHKK